MSIEDGSISRRNFVAGAATGGLYVLHNPGIALGMQASANPAWVDKPLRWAQIAFVENDPAHYSREFWVDYLKRIHAQAACLSAGGCVAFYPTKIPLHHRSNWLGDGDPFGDLFKSCRELGMAVIARTDPHAVLEDAYRAHPEWIAVDAEGQQRRHWAAPDRWVTCGLGPYNFDFMTAVHKEIVTLYDVDGIFINRWSGSGMCYCDSCQTNFRAAHGKDLPRTENPLDAARRDYIVWRQQRLFDLWQLWDTEMRKIRSNSRCIPNTGGGALSTLDMKQIGERAVTLMADRQARRGLMVPWANGKNGKEFRAAMGSKPIVGIFSVGVEEPYRWKDSVQNGAEIRLWAVDGIANGLNPWFTKFSATLHDERWLKPVEDLYRWHHGVERYLRNEKPLARVGMVYSQQTAWFYGGPDARRKLEDHTHGFYHALVEARIPFEMVHDRLLDAAHVDQFKALILPNIAALSDEQCRQLRDFVGRGGSLVATFETSLYDEWGKRRNDFGLGELLGVKFNGKVEHRMQNSYLRLETDPATGRRHPLLDGLEDAPRIINGVQRVDVTVRGEHRKPPLTLVPSYPDLPMEEVYPRQISTDIPEVFLNEKGRGRVVYFPWDIDRTFWEVMSVDHGKLLRNAVLWATGEPPPVKVDGTGVLDVTVWKQKDSITVHLVNLTNPMMMKGPIRELIQIGAQKVEVRLPKGAKARKVHLLVSGTELALQQSGDVVTATVPSILDHEIVAIDLS